MSSRIELHEIVTKLKELAAELDRTPRLNEFFKVVSRRQIYKHGTYQDICRLAGLIPNAHPQSTDPYDVTINPPKILIFDIEVCAAIAYTYQFRDAYIAPENIIQMPYILAFSAKWFGSDEIIYQDTRNTPKDDSELLEALSKLIDEADYLVGHNIVRYDVPMTKGRMLLSNMNPLRAKTNIDTFKIAFKHFKLPFYKLGELAKYLDCNNKKLTHARYPGTTLFIEADKGNIEAFNEMEDYCKMDTIVTEECFKKLMAWEPSINFQAHYGKRICSCGSSKFNKHGLHYAKSGVFQVWRCVECAKTFKDKHNLIDKNTRKEFFS